MGKMVNFKKSDLAVVNKVKGDYTEDNWGKNYIFYAEIIIKIFLVK